MKLLSAIFFFFSILAVQAQNTWTIDKTHSNIEFAATHMVISEVSGHFNAFDATVVSKNEDFSNSQVSFTAQTGSIDTGNDRRDGHLKSDDFFNAEEYPELSFNGTLVREGEKYKLKGDMTIRDITKPVTFDVKYYGKIDTGKGEKAGFKVTGTINRFDYNLNWSNKIQDGSLVVSNEINITANVQLNSPES